MEEFLLGGQGCVKCAPRYITGQTGICVQLEVVVYNFCPEGNNNKENPWGKGCKENFLGGKIMEK